MRLICPNCGAQYEVPDEVIPESGRDVQCSNCGDTWFQHHPDHRPEDPATPDAGSGWMEEPAPPPPPEPDLTAEPSDPDPFYEDEDPEDTKGQAPERRELDPSVAELLREEAEREEQARAAERRGGLETQPDLGLEEQNGGAQMRGEQARARMARLRGTPAEDPSEQPPEEAIDPSSRRNLLPDIEEINSSLSSESKAEAATAAAAAASAATEPDRASGFRSGFRLVVVLAVLGLILYVFAPRLSEAVPALAEPLATYVSAVNDGRMALAQMVNDLAGSITESENSAQ